MFAVAHTHAGSRERIAILFPLYLVYVATQTQTEKEEK